ncbi:MAG: glycosyltransferase family 4 protein [Chloroflexota bacterium]|nr:glycosyltransferase family 4 protein [Chloroflexota bacterium]
MQTKPGVVVPVTEDDTFSTRAPIKVCMHVIQRTRTDARILRDATALVEAGCTVTIVDVESDRTRPPEEDMAGIHVKHIFMPSLFVPARFKPWFLVKLLLVVMRGAMQLVKVQADIYHAHVEKALPACYIATCLLRRPLIFDAPDLTLSDPTIMRRRTLRSLSARLLAHMVSRCAAVITASPYYVSELRTLYRASDVTVVRNVPAYRAVSRNDRLRQRLGLGSEISIALYQGGIQPNRCLDRLVSAAKFLAPNIVIVIMGEDQVPTRSQLEALIASEQVADRVKLLPPVPYTELLEWTASADIGLTIFPPEYSLSIRFTLPNKLFEYLMAGLPVLSSQLDAVAEVIHTYDVGQVAPSLAPADLGGAISAMLNDKVALQRMGHNALQAAKKEFYWEKESQSLVGLYHTILMPSMEYKAAVLPN